MNEENLKEEIKGLSNEIRDWLIQEAKERGYHMTYNQDGSIDLMESGEINGIHTLIPSWTIAPPFDFDEENNKESE